MALNAKRIGGISVSIALDTVQLNKGVSTSKALIGSLATHAKMGAVAIGAALTAAVYKAGAAHEDLNRSMTKSLSIMGNVSDMMRGDLRQAAIDVAKTTKFSASEAADSYMFLASAGLSAEQALVAMPKVAAFAQAGLMDLSAATNYLADAQSALGLTVKDPTKNLQNMIRVSDVLAKGNNVANASIEQLSEGLTTGLGASLRLLNKDVEEGVALLASFADQGIKGAAAGTAGSIVLRDLQTKALKNPKKFSGFGVSVFDADGEMRNLSLIVGEMEKALGGLSDAQKKQALLSMGFTDMSVGFIQNLLGTSVKMKAYEDGLRSAAGTTKDVADKMLTPMEKSLNQLKGAWQELSETMGPAITQLSVGVSKLAELVDMMNRLNWDGVRRYLAVVNPALFLKMSDLDDLAKGGMGGASPLLNPKGNEFPNAPFVNQPTIPESKAKPLPDARKTLSSLFDEFEKKIMPEVDGIEAKRIGGFRLGDIADAALGGWKWQAAGMVGKGLREMDDWKAMKPKQSPRQSLAFAESGSVDSYRQQAAIRRQSEDIAKKQLNVQGQMLNELKGMNRNAVILKPLNLAGR